MLLFLAKLIFKKYIYTKNISIYTYILHLHKKMRTDLCIYNIFLES